MQGQSPNDKGGVNASPPPLRLLQLAESPPTSPAPTECRGAPDPRQGHISRPENYSGIHAVSCNAIAKKQARRAPPLPQAQAQAQAASRKVLIAAGARPSRRPSPAVATADAVDLFIIECLLISPSQNCKPFCLPKKMSPKARMTAARRSSRVRYGHRRNSCIRVFDGIMTAACEYSKHSSHQQLDAIPSIHCRKCTMKAGQNNPSITPAAAHRVLVEVKRLVAQKAAGDDAIAKFDVRYAPTHHPRTARQITKAKGPTHPGPGLL